MKIVSQKTKKDAFVALEEAIAKTDASHCDSDPHCLILFAEMRDKTMNELTEFICISMSDVKSNGDGVTLDASVAVEEAEFDTSGASHNSGKKKKGRGGRRGDAHRAAAKAVWFENGVAGSS